MWQQFRLFVLNKITIKPTSHNQVVVKKYTKKNLDLRASDDYIAVLIIVKRS